MEITDELKRILKIGYDTVVNKDVNAMCHNLLKNCVELTDADGGTLYFAARVEEGEPQAAMSDVQAGDARTDSEASGRPGTMLIHMADYNRRLGIDISVRNGIDMAAAPDDERNLFTHTYRHPQYYLYENIYQRTEFDIQSIRESDIRYGYQTVSVMMIPVCVDEQDVLGVMMVYNHRDEQDRIIPFSQDILPLPISLSVQMANTLSNMLMIDDMETLLSSFVKSLTTAIDAKTPYNGNHTKNVTNYCAMMVDQIDAANLRGETQIHISEEDREQLMMAAQLHDIGKLIIPSSILNKATRLGSGYDELYHRLEKIRLLMKIDYLEGRIDHGSYAMEELKMENFLAALHDLNTKPRLLDEDIARVEDVAGRVYVGIDGTTIPYLTEEEKHKLLIRQGTLTPEEKEIVQQHVVYTDKILSNIRFIKKYDKVRAIASNHHEYLDGSGYPCHKTAEDLDILMRLLTVCDIFDSLMADDRPYKRAIPFPKAVQILQSMAKEGKLDAEIVSLLANNVTEEDVREAKNADN